MRQGLLEQGFDVLPSDANFIFARHAQVPGKVLFDALRARDVLVRRWDKPRISDWLRISVGTPEQTDRLLKAVADSIQAGA